jgi:hypothetical protein
LLSHFKLQKLCPVAIAIVCDKCFVKMEKAARRQWLTPEILATQEAEIRRIVVWSEPGQNSSARPYLKKPFTKIELVEWLKVKPLSSNPNTEKKKKDAKGIKYMYLCNGEKGTYRI